MKGLTKKQQQVFEFIREFIGKHRYAPSFRDISGHFSLRSLASVTKYVHVLHKKGYLSFDQRSARSLQVVEDLVNPNRIFEREIPLIGQITGGQPLEMFSHPQTIGVPAAFVRDPEKTYALRVVGAGLLEEQIAEGDLLIVEAQPHAQNGESILAVINSRNVLVKKFFLEEEYIRLEGTTADHQPIVLHQNDVMIQGVVVGLLRFYTQKDSKFGSGPRESSRD